jgi:hypothetical protein
MRKGIWALLFILIVFSFSLSGCCYFSATKEIKTAEKALSELKAAAGQTQVPYEYCSAEKFLEAAKIEYGQGDFCPAKGFAIRSKSAAQAGLAQTKKK